MDKQHRGEIFLNPKLLRIRRIYMMWGKIISVPMIISLEKIYGVKLGIFLTQTGKVTERIKYLNGGNVLSLKQ